MFTEPLDIIFSGSFSETGTYQSASVPGIFSNPSLEELGVAGRRPRFETKASYFPAIARGQSFAIRSADYTIQDWIYDSTGQVITISLELE